MSPSRVPASLTELVDADVGKDFLTLFRENFSACLTSERSKSSASVSACFDLTCLRVSLPAQPAICPCAVSTAFRAQVHIL